MKILLAQTPFQRLLVFLTVIISIALQYPQPKFDVQFYNDLASNYTTKNGVHPSNNHPLKDVTIVVTGATSGLGLGLTKHLHKLGGTIVAVGRSQSKLTKLCEELDDNKQKRVIPIVGDFSDLDSVASAASKIESKVKRIDFLVNNAGMYSHDIRSESSTPQGYDVVFGVNYLGPFLLTERMLPLLEKSSMHNNPRIIQISSTMHYTVDGSSLIPRNGAPAASLPSTSAVHGMKAYGESKLAQIYHSRSLSRELRSRKSPVQVISLCPSWVATYIAGNNMKNILQLFAYDAESFGIAPFLFAMFTPLLDESNDYVTSCSLLCKMKLTTRFLCWMSWIDKTGFIRHFFASNVAMVVLVLQKLFGSVDFRPSSTESYDFDKQDALYRWSKEAISPWSKKKNRNRWQM